MLLSVVSALALLLGFRTQLNKTSSNDTLVPWVIEPLPLGSIKPEGWLLGELQTLASGLAGHEHDFYVYVNESTWLYPAGMGGTDYSNLDESLPYWFNGLVPLAYLLDDSRLKTQVQDVMRTVLQLASSDGWIGPDVVEKRNFWSKIPFFLGMTQLVEADPSFEVPVVAALMNFMTLANNMLKNNSQGFTNCDSSIDCRWGQARIHDLIITIQWLLEKFPSAQDSMLWENMHLFHDQNEFRWDTWYASGVPEVIDDPSGSNPDFPFLHGVNVGQGFKALAVVRRFLRDDSLVQLSMDAVDQVMLHHGSSSGSILADEIMHNSASYMGSELCTAVETAYSFAYLYQSLGANSYADRAERVIFNALPVMLTGDAWGHQYMDQPNGPWATNNTQDFSGDSSHVFTTANSGAATTFGMEPLLPCCTVNHPQGFPKFVAKSWGLVGEHGLAHALLSPSSVQTTVGKSTMAVTCSTDYPFSNILNYSIEASSPFDLYIRVPSWAAVGQTIFVSSGNSSISGTTTAAAPDPFTGMHKIRVETGYTKIGYAIGATLRTENGPNNTISVFFGNMLYALDVGNDVISSDPHGYYDPTGPGLGYLKSLGFPKLRDYYITNSSAWNVAIDPSTLAYHGTTDETGSLTSPIFAYGAPPNYVSVQGCEVAWDLYLGATPDVAPSSSDCIGIVRTYKLIPYGSAKVHMSELPIMQAT